MEIYNKKIQQVQTIWKDKGRFKNMQILEYAIRICK